MKGQITKHEWSTPNFNMGKEASTCKHCAVKRIRVKGLGSSWTYFLHMKVVSPLPKCVTRKKTEDGTARE